MNKKYSIVISNVSGTENYVTVVSCWQLDEEGKRINEQKQTLIKGSFVEALDFVNEFKNNNG